ncbi:MAG TPA: hypothetical protein VFQ68_00700, partial [Streptosporangiaceae bacterium]|nr:hypothetical protein [Streptosporangiaceae bacterium]
VKVRAELWGCFLGRRRAARKMTAGGAGATIIPLDAIASLRIDRSAGQAGLIAVETLVVTTADGAEYGFRVRGLSGSMRASLAAALARLGREVRATTGGLTITPHRAGDGA